MIQCRPMTAEEYEIYLAAMAPEYAQEHVDAGNWAKEGAVERAIQEMRDDYLPLGVETENNFLFTLVDPEIGESVGMLWYAINGKQGRKQAFVYDVIVEEKYRRRGYASQAFREMENQVKAAGVKEIGLHVFGYNTGAKEMYEKLGFRVTDYTMRKWL